MKRHGNTLYVTTQGAYLARDGQCLVVRVQREDRLRLPLHTIDGVVCFGRVSCSPPLMGFCGEQGVAVSFLSLHGRFLGRLVGPVSGNVLLRREQYRWADDVDGHAARIAQTIVAAKIANARTVLLRSARDHPEKAGGPAVAAGVRQLGHTLETLRHALPLDRVRGEEGDAARVYFGVFDHLITDQKDAFAFRGRSRQPPLDFTNALLSFVYALLVHDCRSALETVGLDPAVGFLHRDRPGRPSLALDLMEEFRPVIADRLVLSLINRRQVAPQGFRVGETGAVEMDDATRRTVLVAYQKRKQDETTHPFLGDRTTVGLLPHLQAMLLARHLRGDLDAYPAFFWK